MGKGTGIAWTNNTFNLGWGCSEKSPGCANCYARNLADNRMGLGLWGTGKVRLMSDRYWKAPLKWEGRVFTSSMADIGDEVWQENGQLDRLWDLIRKTPHLTWQLLTKRNDRLQPGMLLPWDWSVAKYPNVWLGVSVENQYWTKRIADLREIEARVKWVSAEPQLEAIDWSHWIAEFDWLVIGGESAQAKKARPFQYDWAREGVRWAKRFGKAVFVKQMGSTLGLKDRAGADPAEWPLDLQVREFPY